MCLFSCILLFILIFKFSDRRIEDILKAYSIVQTGQPIPCGYIFEKILKKYGSLMGISEWATRENARNSFSASPKSIVGVLSLIYQKRNSGCNFIAFENKCKQVAHSVAATTFVGSSTALSSNTTWVSTHCSNTTPFNYIKNKWKFYKMFSQKITEVHSLKKKRTSKEIEEKQNKSNQLTGGRKVHSLLNASHVCEL